MALIDILYRDEQIIAVNKPAGIVVHRSRMTGDQPAVLQVVRELVGQYVYPAHRLDRPTSGVLLFALDADMARALQQQWTSGRVRKTYLAVVRGYVDEAGEVDTPLRSAKDEAYREARTRYRRLATVELPIPMAPHPTTRYSLVELEPLTGRMHQLRKHMKYLAHPIIGDTQHGRAEHNKLFSERLGVEGLMLHAWRLVLDHPASGEPLELTAPMPENFRRAAEAFGWSLPDVAPPPATTVTVPRPVGARLAPSTEYPNFWAWDDEPVMLLGGSVEDNLFQVPDLNAQLDALAAVGGNYVRCTMSSRDPGDLWPFEREPEGGPYDLEKPDPEYWRRFGELLERTAERGIAVQIEIWDRFDFAGTAWQSNPFNPAKNRNYTVEASALPEAIDSHPSQNANPFFRTVPAQDHNETVLRFQHAFVDQVLHLSLPRAHVLYCMDNETTAAPAWGAYWSQYIRDAAEAAGTTVYTTEMWDAWDLTDALHEHTWRHPERYAFVDVSQNNHLSGAAHWERLIDLRQRMRAAGVDRPLNAVKIYGANAGPYGRDREGQERCWQCVLGGVAAARFHRPPAGLGLSPLARQHLLSLRLFLDAVELFRSEPVLGGLENASPGEAFLSRAGDGTDALFFPDGGDLVLPLAEPVPDAVQLRWLNIADARWAAERVAEVTDGRVRLVTPRPSGFWACVVRPL